jgi:hypothetical protein
MSKQSGERASEAAKKDSGNRVNKSISALATVIAIIALLLAGWGLSVGTNAENIAKWCAAHQVQGPTGAAGASAYTLWLAVGNKGSLQNFLDSLVGEKGEDGYKGSTGFNGADGEGGRDGASAYQLWLDEGNSGTPEEFLTSLIGVDGAGGANGAAGLSAYELWVAQGNSGTETDFLNSLVGKAGTDGTDGINGSNGKSAYEIWLEAGNTGTEIDFLASLRGADGTCTPGSGLGYFGSFYSTVTQTNDLPINVMTYNNSSPNSDGVSISNGSRIVIANPGTYNIAFSAQITRLSGGNSQDIEIWLKQNGVNSPDSTTVITTQSNAHKVVAAWNFFVTTTNENEYFEIAWASPEPSMELLWRAPNSTPGIPSVILTVNQVN